MFLSNAAVRRPVGMSCLILGLTLLGLNSYRKMGLEIMPKVDIPYITVITVYPGASPGEIETDIAKRIEDAVVAISGLKHVSSSSIENVCQTLLEFNLDVDVDLAAMDVREKLDLIRMDFPEGVEDPKVVKFDTNAKPVLSLALTGNVPLDELYDYADNTLRDRISVISGVANVDLVGGAEREVHVLVDREKLAARGLTTLNLVRSLQEGVRTIPSGRIRSHGVEYSVKFDAEFKDIDLIGNLEISGGNGQRTYIKDVAHVRMNAAELRQLAHIDGRPAVAIKVVKRAEANAVQVIDTVKQAVERLQPELPGGMELVWVTDDGVFTKAMIDSAWLNVGQGILLTALILFLFLYNIRSTLVIAITMPLTIIMGLFFMQAVGFTLNLPTLLSIGMSVGILVTNSIVVLEAIVKRLDSGKSPEEASRLGASEAFVAVLASAGTNVVVLFPIAVMPGMIGLFMKPFALTMVIVTLVSLFVSFTLTPMLCSLLLKPKNKDSRSPLAYMEWIWNLGFDGVVALYRRLLQFAEHYRLAAILLLLVVAVIFVHSLKIGSSLGSSMGTEPDRGEVFIKLEFPAGNTLARTTESVAVIEKRLQSLPHLRHILTTIGKVEGMFGQAPEGVHMAQILLRFNERTDRKETIVDLMGLARGKIADFPGILYTLTMPNFTGGQASDIEFEIAGPDLATLDGLALKAQEIAGEIPGFRDPDTTVRPGKPELRVRPDRAVLADLGFPATSLGMILRGNIEGITAGTFKRDARNYDIVVKFSEEEGKEQVGDFLFPAAPGRPMSLANIGTIEEGLSPVQIPRKDKSRISKLFANLDPSLPMGTAVQILGEEFERRAALPPGYSYQFTGVYEVMAEGMEALAEAGLIAILLVVLMLAAILESFKQPILILVTLPLALIGVYYSLYFGGHSMGIFVMMSIVMLIGIVVNNAILIMDQFNVHVASGMSRHGAMVNAACERFRPIVMITLAAVLGMLPLAFGRGIGAEMRNDTGLASAGGILVSGILTLLVMPVLYDLFTRKAKNKNTHLPQSPETSKEETPSVEAAK